MIKLTSDQNQQFAFLKYHFFGEVFLDHPSSEGKESACNTGDLGSIPGSGRLPGEENGYPLQYCCLDGQKNLTGYSPWGHKESDTTELLTRFLDHPIQK